MIAATPTHSIPLNSTVTVISERASEAVKLTKAAREIIATIIA
jgi:hypothetical protein